MPILLEIVTPEAQIFSGEVDTVTVPGIAGEMGVLPNHSPLVTTLHPGELTYVAGGQSHELAVGEGVLEVRPDGVSVVTDMAIGDADIDENVVEEALKRAQEALKESDKTPEEVAATEAAILKSLAQLKLKRKRRSI